MRFTKNAIATALAGVVAESTPIAAQATVDLENRYPNVGVLMVWRVDEAGKPVELRGFASGTLIRDRVMLAAGRFVRHVAAATSRTRRGRSGRCRATCAAATPVAASS